LKEVILIYPIVVCLLGLWYIAWRVERIEKQVEKLVAKLAADKDAEEEVSVGPEAPLSFLPDEWTDRPWWWKTRHEERRPLENPTPLQNPDDFQYLEIVGRLKSLSEPLDRIAFLSALRSRQAYFNENLTGAVLRDVSPLVRAWGAANLSTEFRDYKDHEFGKGEAPLIVDFEEVLLRDGDPLVKASLWKHADYKRLPWGRFGRALNQQWVNQFKDMSQLDRFALMHNIELSSHFIVALLNVDTARVGDSARRARQTSLHGSPQSAYRRTQSTLWPGSLGLRKRRESAIRGIWRDVGGLRCPMD
jgi:hypothetical protein